MGLRVFWCTCNSASVPVHCFASVYVRALHFLVLCVGAHATVLQYLCIALVLYMRRILYLERAQFQVLGGISIIITKCHLYTLGRAIDTIHTRACNTHNTHELIK